MESDQLIFAGLDRDGRAALFFFDRERGSLTPILHEDWLKVLSRFEAAAGEMLVVGLQRQPWKSGKHIRIEFNQLLGRSRLVVPCGTCGHEMMVDVRRQGDIEDENRIGRGEYFPFRDPKTPIAQDAECSFCHTRWQAMMFGEGHCILSPRRPSQF